MPPGASNFLDGVTSRDEFYKSQVFVNLAMLLLSLAEQAVRQGLTLKGSPESASNDPIPPVGGSRVLEQSGGGSPGRMLTAPCSSRMRLQWQWPLQDRQRGLSENDERDA